MRIHDINHPEELVKKKVNYFADYFYYVQERVNRDELISSETPLSIIENLLIQLNNNFNRCLPYFNKYINNELICNFKLSTGKNLIKKFNSLLEPYRVLEKKEEQIEWLKTNKVDLIKSCTSIKKRLTSNMFKECVQAITSYLKCSHTLEFHKDELELFTKIIVSDFLMNGFTSSDLKKVFQYILSNDIRDFPFDKKLFFKVDKEFREKIKSVFIKNKTFADQFDGITNIRFKPQKTAFLLYKINGIYLENDSEINLGDVSIISSKAKKLSKIKKSRASGIKRFFEDDHSFSIAILKERYRSENKAFEKAIYRIDKALKIFNSQTKYVGRLNSFDVIITTDFKEYRSQVRASSVERVRNITKHEVQRFNRRHINLIRGIDSPAAKKMLEYESIYESAIINNSLHEYWHYMESLHSKVYLKGLPNKVIENVPKVILTSYCKYLNDNYKNLIYNIAIMDPMDVGFLQSDYHKINNYKKFDLEEVKVKAINPFVLELIRVLNIENNKTSLSKPLIHNQNIFLEAYEFRNHFIHSGKEIENIKIRLLTSLPILIERYRAILIGSILKDKTKKLSSIIQVMCSKSERNYLR